MRSAMQRLRIAAAIHNVNVRDEGVFVVLASADHPHGLGVAVEVRGERYIRLPEELVDGEIETADIDVVMSWVDSV